MGPLISVFIISCELCRPKYLGNMFAYNPPTNPKNNMPSNTRKHRSKSSNTKTYIYAYISGTRRRIGLKKVAPGGDAYRNLHTKFQPNRYGGGCQHDFASS